VCDEPVSGVDLLPTIAAITGVKVPGDRAIDGASMMPILDEKPIERQTPLFWVFPVASSKPKAALRVGDWKVLAHVTGPDFTPTGDIEAEFQQTIKTARLAAFELYNLRTDVGETTDLAAKERKRLGQMATQLQSLYQSVQQETPVWPAWRWPREESKRIEWPSYWVKKAKPKKKQGQ
jgi:arylsulfatase A